MAHPMGHVEVLPSPTPYSRALDERLPQVVNLIPEPPWLATDPARGRDIRESGAHSLLVVPLTVRDAVLGLVSLYRTTSENPYDENDLALALDLARHTALCTDNARRYTHDHSVAATVLQHTVPVQAPSGTALETTGMARPCDGATPGTTPSPSRALAQRWSPARCPGTTSGPQPRWGNCAP